ncbi:MAG: hypothetical protein ACOYB4_02235 [Methyloceanibacter sp.]
MTMTRENIEAAGSVLERLRNLEQRRQDVFEVSPSDPVLHLHGLAAERVEKIKAIVLALYEAEIAVARAQFHVLGVEEEAA